MWNGCLNRRQFGVKAEVEKSRNPGQNRRNLFLKCSTYFLRTCRFDFVLVSKTTSKRRWTF